MLPLVGIEPGSLGSISTGGNKFYNVRLILPELIEFD